MFAFYFTREFCRLLMTMLLGSYKAYGRDNIPDQGPYLLVTNHMSLSDSPLLLLSIKPGKLHFFAGEKWEHHWLFGPFLRWLGGTFINRGTVDRKALNEAFAVLDAGGWFGLAPEGTRSRTGQMHKGLEGAAYLATRANVPLLPVGFVNTDQLKQNAKRLKRTRLECHFGEPFTLPDIGRKPRQRDLPAYTHYIMIHIAAQLPERYHGYYADSPGLAALLRGEDPWPHCVAAEGLSLDSLKPKPSA